MKIVSTIALILGMALGTTAFAEGRDDGPIYWTHGIGTECWQEEGRGGPYEVCGTIFAGAVEDDEYADRR
ncbi:hypothetical protein CMI38_04300 [Candidatus Pacearchaeota archaeon]|mgnify:CR=1 FL=1|jgi:hypothetical protein|nr:hypothetical protein [Candidatus Pacearchaeota archaeon]|tara:strand:- start:82 stop:291 length:210 start_codon:yes stop_codon:yes gene_type:complete